MTITEPATRTALLGAYAARSCPVKTQNTFDPTVHLPPAAPTTGPGPGGSLDGRARFVARVLDELITGCRGLVVDLRLLEPESAELQTQACVRALTTGAQVVIAGLLPPDVAGHRVGRPDLLVRGLDRSDGRPGYHAVVVKAHQILDRPRRPAAAGEPEPEPAQPEPAQPEPAQPVAAWSSLVEPAPQRATPLVGRRLRLGYREGDVLQLAHYHRMLEAAGFAADRPLAAVIGTDVPPSSAGPVSAGLVWTDLATPAIRTFSRRDPDGWRLRSPLERYDHEQAFRVDIAAVAAQQGGDPGHEPALLVRPVVSRECSRCPWWEHCRPQLDPDDVSLRIDKGALDRREITTLRRRGIETVTQLASSDLEALLPVYLPEVSHRGGAEARLRSAVRRARMLLAGVAFDRETSGPIPIPAADVEIDFDIESSADGRVYLWGFLVDTGDAPPTYREFSRFGDLDDEAETALALEALGWLRSLVEDGLVEDGRVEGGRVAVYHYSGYEVDRVTELAAREEHELLDWAAAYAAREFVDLLEVVKTHFFGVNGLGLKLIARQAGFRWRDEDPGGLNSQRWFADAVHGPDPTGRERARLRVLDYNEDDVIATHRLRGWLRDQ